MRADLGWSATWAITFDDMARLARELLPDGIFHVTARAVYEFPLFIDDADRHGFVHLLRRLEVRHGIHCRGYCPDGQSLPPLA